MALALDDRALTNGTSFAGMTFDEGYGGQPDFWRGLVARRPRAVGEIPRSFTGWLAAPRVVRRPYPSHRRGRGRRVPRRACGSRRAQGVEERRHAPALREPPWPRGRVKDGAQGPVVWEGQPVRFLPKDANGLPGPAPHLLRAGKVLDPTARKCFRSNAAVATRVGTRLRGACSRWRSERGVEAPQGARGLAPYEGRRYLGRKRPRIWSRVRSRFLARVREEGAGEKSGADRVPAPPPEGGAGALVVA